MNQEQSKALGALLRQKRQELGYSMSQLAQSAGVGDTTVMRIERGEFAAPRPDKLARLAGLLGISLADLFVKAGYVVPDELPTIGDYLNAKYPELPDAAVEEVQGLCEQLLNRHMVGVDQPRPELEELTHDRVGGTA